MSIKLQSSLSLARIAKRSLDLVGAFIGLIVVSPLLVILGILIKLNSSGPVLYRQTRVGRGGAPFLILKYRTMEESAEGLLDLQLAADPALQPGWVEYQKIYDDPRLTWIGRILRRTSVDELPQLWNVLRGEMSLVGPRPILPEQRDLYGDRYRYYIQVRPGMTGLWQISGRNNLSFMKRAERDQEYIENWSFTMDLYILARTVWTVISGEGAF